MSEPRAITPFLAILMNQIASDYQTKIGIDIDRHDYAIEYAYKEKGQLGLKKRYENEDGKQLHFDDRNLIQTFGIVEKLAIVEPRFSGSCMGTTFLAGMAFVVMGLNGCDPVKLWKGMDIFKYDNIFFSCGINSAGDTVNISGKIQGNTEVNFHPMTITEKYFPEQLDKMQRNQLSITAIEFRFRLLVENICDLCLSYP